MIYTAQYRYPGKDRLDITVKGNDALGKLYAPTWKMVTGVKNGTMSAEKYEGLYYNLLCERWKTLGPDMMRLIEFSRTKDITVVCFCPARAFCHRHLLIKFLQHNWAVEYGGERTGF